MNNKLLYFVTVGIWGSTWIAIKFQLGTVAPEVSVVYRFALAAALMIGFSLLRKLSLRFSWREHLFIAAQGLFLFCLNYILVYLAEGLLTSGLIAMIFSLVIVFNTALGALFLGNPVRVRVLVGAVFGIGGLVMVFWREVDSFDLSNAATLGLIMGLVATLSASIGNIISARNQRSKLPVVQTNAFGMAYGAGFTFLFAISRGAEFTFDLSFSYLASLLFLALFGSITAFWAYLTLLGRIGPDRAAYVTVLFPVVALAISTAVEGLQWTALSLSGVALVLIGNVIVLTRLGNLRLRRKAAERV